MFVRFIVVCAVLVTIGQPRVVNAHAAVPCAPDDVFCQQMQQASGQTAASDYCQYVPSCVSGQNVPPAPGVTSTDDNFAHNSGDDFGFTQREVKHELHDLLPGAVRAWSVKCDDRGTDMACRAHRSGQRSSRLDRFFRVSDDGGQLEIHRSSRGFWEDAAAHDSL